MVIPGPQNRPIRGVIRKVASSSGKTTGVGSPASCGTPLAPAQLRFFYQTTSMLVKLHLKHSHHIELKIYHIIAHDLARTHISYYNNDARRTKGM